jgi:chromosome segregation ATPase
MSSLHQPMGPRPERLAELEEQHAPWRDALNTAIAEMEAAELRHEEVRQQVLDAQRAVSAIEARRPAWDASDADALAYLDARRVALFRHEQLERELTRAAVPIPALQREVADLRIAEARVRQELNHCQRALGVTVRA